METYTNSGIRITKYEHKDESIRVGGRRYRNVFSVGVRFLTVEINELFPCFDSSDYTYEDRYYHWYIITRNISQFIETKRKLKKEKIGLPTFYDMPSPNKDLKKEFQNIPLPLIYFSDDYKNVYVVEAVETA